MGTVCYHETHILLIDVLDITVLESAQSIELIVFGACMFLTGARKIPCATVDTGAREFLGGFCRDEEMSQPNCSRSMMRCL